MALIIPADVQERVNVLLGMGRYTSEEEILRVAVAALEQQNGDLAAIQSGVNDLVNERFQPFTDFDAEFRKQNQIENDA